MTNRIISVEYDIHPAQDATCGDGKGGFCAYCSWRIDNADAASCDLFGRLRVVDGWIQRHANCIKAEGRTKPPADEVDEDVAKQIAWAHWTAKYPQDDSQSPDELWEHLHSERDPYLVAAQAMRRLFGDH